MPHSTPPVPQDNAEAQRVEHTRLRRRMLYSSFRADIVERLIEAVGDIRRSAWGNIDMTSNPFLSVWTQLSALYLSEPVVVPPDGGEDAARAVEDAGYWTLMQRIQRDTLGMREMIVRVEMVDGLPTFRPVYPDMVECETDRHSPGQPLKVRELMRHPEDPDKWIWLVTEPETRTYKAVDKDGGDVSQEVLGGVFSGDNYPWLAPDGRALMPYIVYHAANTGWMWDPYTGREVVEGTLQLSVFYSFFSHVNRNTAWKQRYILGAEPAGLGVSVDGRPEMVTDPATVIMLRQLEDYEGQPMIGQWDDPTDPQRVIDSIQTYERRVISMALGAAEVTRREADVRSGYSLAVSRESQRSAQRSYEPMFRRSDLLMLSTVSQLMGAPADGWRIEYAGVPDDPNEVRARIDRITTLIDAGLMDRITAYQELNPGLTREEAISAVAEIGRINNTARRAAPDEERTT